ncbi:MAG: cation:proton antiporter [Candidatus Latescibacterota bacterium]
MNTLLIVGLAISLSFTAGWLIHRLKFPMVTGYVIMGVILGSSMIGLFDVRMLDQVGIVADLALGVIAFSIGGELRRDVFKQLGKSIFSIVLLETLGAFALVATAMYFLTHKIHIALILGAVSAATAPAATVAVLQQYRARGPLSTTILAVVGIDDAIALIIYAFASSIAKAFIGEGEHVALSGMVLTPIIEIFGAIGVGLLMGGLVSVLSRGMRDQAQLLTLAAGAVLISSGIAVHYHLSELLTNMALAMTFVNLGPPRRSKQVLDVVQLMGFPIIAGFFCLAGARLDIGLLPKIGWIGLVYAVTRMAGKLLGASAGAYLSKAPESVRKYIGFSLWPQIGVALALAITVGKDFDRYGSEGHFLAALVINILLFTTLITEIVGPLMTRWAIGRAGEIGAARPQSSTPPR